MQHRTEDEEETLSHGMRTLLMWSKREEKGGRGTTARHVAFVVIVLTAMMS